AELVIAAKVGIDRLLELARQGLAAAIGLHPLPEMDVVVVLAGIVEQRRVLAVARLDDLLERLAFEARPFEQLVAVGHIGLMVLVVMKFERFGGHIFAERVIGIGEFGKGKAHLEASLMMVISGA